MTTDIDELIAEVERLDREATPGPWVSSADRAIVMTNYRDEGGAMTRENFHANGTPKAIVRIGGAGTWDDCDLVALGRTAAPLLVAEVRRLRAELSRAVVVADLARAELTEATDAVDRMSSRLTQSIHCEKRANDALNAIWSRTTTACAGTGLSPANADVVPEIVTILVQRLRAADAEMTEARLTLAAEQGRQEGAPYDNPELVLAMVNGERIRRGLSWRELATILGVSPSTLTRWTHGKMLSVPAYLLVCKWLNAAINETIDIVDANGPGWCDRCSPDRCDCEDDDTARAAMLAADGGEP